MSSYAHIRNPRKVWGRVKRMSREKDYRSMSHVYTLVIIVRNVQTLVRCSVPFSLIGRSIRVAPRCRARARVDCTHAPPPTYIGFTIILSKTAAPHVCQIFCFAVLNTNIIARWRTIKLESTKYDVPFTYTGREIRGAHCRCVWTQVDCRN